MKTNFDKRIEEIKKENDEINQQIMDLESKKQEFIQF